MCHLCCFISADVTAQSYIVDFTNNRLSASSKGQLNLHGCLLHSASRKGIYNRLTMHSANCFNQSIQGSTRQQQTQSDFEMSTSRNVMQWPHLFPFDPILTINLTQWMQFMADVAHCEHPLSCNCKFKVCMLFTHTAGKNMHLTRHLHIDNMPNFPSVHVLSLFSNHKMVLYYKFIQRNLELLDLKCI